MLKKIGVCCISQLHRPARLLDHTVHQLPFHAAISARLVAHRPAPLAQSGNTGAATGKEEKIDVSGVAVSMNGIELQDREFFAAIAEGRQPNSSVASVLPCYQVLHALEQQLNAA